MFLIQRRAFVGAAKWRRLISFVRISDGAGGAQSKTGHLKTTSKLFTDASFPSFARRSFSTDEKVGKVAGSTDGDDTLAAAPVPTLSWEAGHQLLPQETHVISDVVAASLARPLSIPKELVVFQSDGDVEEVLTEASRRCYTGAGFFAAGCGTFLASSVDVFPPIVLAALCVGCFGNTYALAVVAQRVLRNSAVRHVERIVVLPTIHDSSPVVDEKEPKGIASVMISAAPVSERLAVTPELRLEVRTAGADRFFSIVDRRPENAEQASFGDLCSRLRLLHIDIDTGTCRERALLDALSRTEKVVADERAEVRENGIPAGPMLSDVTIQDVLEGEKAVGAESPVEAMVRLASRSRTAGVATFIAGILFFIGEGARDRDGVARWTNLWWLDF
eukprot:TRINITY_DN51233_c0_g1_i1.p1 TRINITY_DN51233_c0_g1~~TRINITY_DN51233_c0_g1_i1.p1  ORF type:complete len:390 (+),score=52.72 TRINITY_DN51233_c0_g1_i1:106-1275(+)